MQWTNKVRPRSQTSFRCIQWTTARPAGRIGVFRFIHQTMAALPPGPSSRWFIQWTDDPAPAGRFTHEPTRGAANAEETPSARSPQNRPCYHSPAVLGGELAVPCTCNPLQQG